jgi:hypothetical protein
MILVCSGLALDRFTHDSNLFRFWLLTCLYMILVCSGLALDRFTNDSSLFRFGFRQVYT